MNPALTSLQDKATYVFLWPLHAWRLTKIWFWVKRSLAIHKNDPRARGRYMAPRLATMWPIKFMVVNCVDSIMDPDSDPVLREYCKGVIDYLEEAGHVSFPGERPW